MSKIVTRFLPLLLLCHLFPGGADAQQSSRPPILGLGDAVVSGFSGTAAPDPNKPRPANKSIVDLTFINPDGHSARVVGVGRPGYVWDGRLFQAPKTFDVFAKDTGQVFGVALDDQPAPNIYLAATSVFGLNLIGRGADGSPERRKVPKNYPLKILWSTMVLYSDTHGVSMSGCRLDSSRFCLVSS